MSAYHYFMWTLIGGMIAIPVVYVLARVASIAWYKGKLAYQRRLINGLTEGGVTDGKSTEE